MIQAPRDPGISFRATAHHPRNAYRRVLIRATNWVGDSILSMPAVEAIRIRFPDAHLAVLARPWVADLYQSPLVDEVIPYTVSSSRQDWPGRWRAAHALRKHQFDAAILLQNAFDAALVTWLARIPVRIGYDLKRRGRLLTHPVAVPKPGEIPTHQRFYYLELLRRAGIIEKLPEPTLSQFPGLANLRETGRQKLNGRWIGVSPGSANGLAKRWLPERFAEAAALAARELQTRVAVFGSPDEQDLCNHVSEQIQARRIEATSFAGHTSLGQFMELVAACF